MSMETLQIEVVYCPSPHQADIVSLRMAPDATVRAAIEASGILQRHPEIDLMGKNKVGIYARVVTLDTPLRDRDRVEIYRPLIADPKTARRKKSEKAAGDAAV